MRAAPHPAVTTSAHGPRRSALSLVVALLLAACGGGDGGDQAAEGDQAADGGAGGGGTVAIWSTETQPERVAATREILGAFTEATGIEAELNPVDEDDLPNLIVANAASGDLPDVVYHPLDFTAGWAQQGILDVEASNAIVEELGRDTFAEGALRLLSVEDQVAAVPSDAWGQLLIYRTDLFEEAGLDRPETFEQILAAAEALHAPDDDLYAITASTDPSQVFTQQTFEHLALANGCRLVEGEEVVIGSQSCTNAVRFFAELMRQYSPPGAQGVESTRATYFAGQAAMIIWSPFILDEMAGLRDSALPSCPQCADDPAFLAKNSGFVPAPSGPDGEGTQYGQISSWGVTADADTDVAGEFIRFMLTDGYSDWLAISPEGKLPMRRGTPEASTRFVDEWRQLEIGVDRTGTLDDLYGEEVVNTLTQGAENFARWGFAEGYGQLVAAVYESLVVPQTVNEVLNGGLAPPEATEQLRDEVQRLFDQVAG